MSQIPRSVPQAVHLSFLLLVSLMPVPINISSELKGLGLWTVDKKRRLLTCPASWWGWGSFQSSALSKITRVGDPSNLEG